MPAHAPVAVPAKAWTLLAQLADGESCTVSSRPRFGASEAGLREMTIVRVAPGGDAPTGDEFGDAYADGDTVVYDGPNDLYIKSEVAVTVYVAS